MKHVPLEASLPVANSLGMNRHHDSATQEEQDKAAIQAVIQADVRSYLDKDINAWSRCFLQEERLVSIMHSNGGLLESRGFESFRAKIERAMVENPDPIPAEFEQRNMEINLHGDMAWATYEEVIHSTTGDPMEPPSLTKEVRVLERVDGRWVIAFHGMFEPHHSDVRGPLIEVDNDGRVLWQNAPARDRLRSFPALTISAGKLRATRPSWDQTLRDTIGNAARLRNYPEYFRNFRGSDRDATFPAVLGEDEEGGVLVCLISVVDFRVYVSFDDAEALDRRLAMAGLIYGLSETQLRLAREIINGQNMPAAGRAMEISTATARTHLSRMFEKTGVHSQPALVRLLLSIG